MKKLILIAVLSLVSLVGFGQIATEAQIKEYENYTDSLYKSLKITHGITLVKKDINHYKSIPKNMVKETGIIAQLSLIAFNEYNDEFF